MGRERMWEGRGLMDMRTKCSAWAWAYNGVAALGAKAGICMTWWR